MHGTSLLGGSLTVLAVAGVLALAAPARADTQLAGDLDYASPLDSEADGGGGFALRIGQQFHVPLLAITPEAVFSLHEFSGTYGPTTYRGMAGIRLGLGELLRPGAFVHLGMGRLDLDVSGADLSRTDFTYDVGLFLDLTVLPLLNVGVHGSYNRLNGDGDSAFEWLVLGAHAELIL